MLFRSMPMVATMLAATRQRAESLAPWSHVYDFDMCADAGIAYAFGAHWPESVPRDGTFWARGELPAGAIVSWATYGDARTAVRLADKTDVGRPDLESYTRLRVRHGGNEMFNHYLGWEVVEELPATARAGAAPYATALADPACRQPEGVDITDGRQVVSLCRGIVFIRLHSGLSASGGMPRSRNRWSAAH